MKTLPIIFFLATSSILSGCAVKNDETRLQGFGLTYQSDVIKLKNGDYYTEVEAAPTAGRISGAEGAANKKASDYCRTQNKALRELKTETDSHLLINGVARLTFTCI